MEKFNIMGMEVVKVDEIKNAIRHIRKDAAFLYDDSKDAVNCVCDMFIRQLYYDELKAAKTQEEEAAIMEMTGDFIIYNSDSPKVLFFTGFDDGAKVTEHYSQCMVFSYESKAQEVAEQLGDGWKVLDASEEEYQRSKRLLDTLFEDDGK